MNEKSLCNARRVGDETAPRHYADDKLREEGCGTYHVTDGQAEEEEEHGLMQLFAPDNRNEHQQVAEHHEHIQKGRKEEGRIDVRVRQAQSLQLKQVSIRGSVCVHPCSMAHSARSHSLWKYLATVVRCAVKEGHKKRTCREQKVGASVLRAVDYTVTPYLSDAGGCCS